MQAIAAGSARATARRLRAIVSGVAAFAAVAGSPILGATLQGQVTPPPTGRLSGGAHGQVSKPEGDFANNTGTGWGFGANVVYRFDESAIANWRADLSFLTYGNERRRIPLGGTGGLIQLDLRTSNNIFTLVTGPQLLGPKGVVMPYAAALGGFSVFWTESTIEGTQEGNTPFASTTNHNDAALAYGGAAGVYVRVHEGTRPVRLDLGARLLRHDNVKYLNDERVREAFENDRPAVPLRGRADFVTFYVGVNAWIF